MNDFSEIENELMKLRPVQVSHEFAARVERAIADPESRERKIIGPIVSALIGLRSVSVLPPLRFSFC